jgi:hypothetical protein
VEAAAGENTLQRTSPLWSLEFDYQKSVEKMLLMNSKKWLSVDLTKLGVVGAPAEGRKQECRMRPSLSLLRCQ